MKISGKSFLGFEIPSIPSGTTCFNSSPYGEIDLTTSILRENWLTINTGKDSNESEFFWIKIQGVGKIDAESYIKYYSDSLFVWGEWKKENGRTINNFLGIVTGLKKGSAQFYLDLNPKKISAE